MDQFDADVPLRWRGHLSDRMPEQAGNLRPRSRLRTGADAGADRKRARQYDAGRADHDSRDAGPRDLSRSRPVESVDASLPRDGRAGRARAPSETRDGLSVFALV